MQESVGVSESIRINFKSDMFGSGYKAYIDCQSLCTNSDGSNVFNSPIDIINTRQLEIQNVNVSQTSTMKFSVRINNGPVQNFDIEVYGPPE